MNNECVKVRFCHDMEDGWYSATFPDGRVVERNWWTHPESDNGGCGMTDELEGYCVIWVGDQYYKPKNFPNPPEYDESVEKFLDEVRVELTKARKKFPGDRIMTIALAEEFGELCKAILDESSANVRKEAVQTAVMAARIVLDGDGSVKDWRKERGLDELI